jgi:serine/threonine-protein kinase
MKASATVDARSDVWALAVTLYQLVAGSTPFHAKGLEVVMTRVFFDPPDPLSTYRADVPAGFEGVIRMALEKDRERRFPSVAALAAALAPYGTAEATMYAARAARVLGEQVAVSRPTAEIHAPTEAALTAAAANPPAPAITDGAMLHATVTPPPARRSRAWMAGAALAVVLAGAVGAVAVFGSRGRTLGPASAGPGPSASTTTSAIATSSGTTAAPAASDTAAPLVSAAATTSATATTSTPPPHGEAVRVPKRTTVQERPKKTDVFLQ